jgi:hypothetical protein
VTNYHQKACAALPELQELIDAHAHAMNEFKSTATTTVKGRDALVSETRAAILAGEPVPADLGEQLYAADHAVEWWTARKVVVKNIADSLKDEREYFEKTHGDELIEVLKPELVRILDEAAEIIPRLQGATTADAVIDSGGDAVAAWSDLGVVANDYADLRRAHWEILRTCWTDSRIVLMTYEHGVHSAILHAEELWTEGTPPWPIEDTLRPTSRPTTNRAFLLWANGNREHVWLPTVSEVRAERDRYREATQVEPQKLDPLDVARNERWRAAQRANGGQAFAAN